MNNKGYLPFPVELGGVIQASFAGVVALVVATGIVLTPSHQIRKYEKKCVYFGGSADSCKSEAVSKTKDERIAYIRDTQDSPSSVWDR